MRRKIILLLLLVLAAVAGWWWWQGQQPASTTYLTAPVSRGTVEVTVAAEGTVKPTNLVAVGAQASGRIIRLAVGLGDRVVAGDLIAEIDSVNQENALRTAEATLAQLQAQRLERQASLSLAEKTLSRQQQLVRNQTVARSDYDSAEEAVEAAKAQIAALDAQIISAEVSISNAQANLDYTRVTAPADGTVLAVVAQAGQTVNAVQSSPTIVVLGQLDKMTVQAEISEADIARISIGQQVRFSLLGDNARQYEGVLESIAPAPRSIINDSAINSSNTDTGSDSAVYYIGEIPVDNADGHLRTYMTAEVTIVQGQAADVLTIPATALGRRNPDGSYQVRVLVDGQPETRNVTTGLNDKVIVEITEGLREGEQVITGEADGTAINSATARRAQGMMGGPPMGR
ncbi:MAG: efflux RND transporter periplasmic adaptor subunit [Paracoccus sp. (in: a-proteobacteria)]|uniref:efflux RND transporter periplasmic adaptor subunit n=1 Tax=Paracoccus sp. TaxID=267 RepID=UPI0026DFBC99|nr:efflux RND transporter periplasmic adaptor subunit [Paracoccus sp. (in: a-proteobacteria)]MDO5620304.1 efflux RND transporter periplasmic adaptor subunit [Paracoccus sp. (in: a-proteobacteria)]